MVFTKELIPFKAFKNMVPESKSDICNKKIGWICTYTPEEIILAAGFTPSRIIGTEKAKRSEGYFPINFCPFIKSSMEDILLNGSSYSGIVFTNSCDGMRRFFDTCKTYVKQIPSFILDVPRINNKNALLQYANNISHMAKFLENISGTQIDIGDLGPAIELINNKKRLLKKLNEYFISFKKNIGIKNYFDILISAMTEEPTLFVDRLENYMQEVLNTGDDGKTGPVHDNNSVSPRIMIIGNFIDEGRLWDIFDELDCIIASDDTCNSGRYLNAIVDRKSSSCLNDEQNVLEYIDSGHSDEVKKAFAAIACGYLLKPQCLRMGDLGAKLTEIKANIKKNNINGVIFISQKFCDNTLLFYPLLRQELNKTGIQSLFLEIEHNNFSAGQIKTRIQAFLEIC